MRKKANDIASALLLLLIALPLASLLVLQGWQWYLKHTAKERLEKELLETVVVKKHEFRWDKEGKEIRVAGRMFDVKSLQIQGEDILVTGIFDEKETAINAMLATQFEKNSLLIRLLAFTQLFFSLAILFSVSKPAQQILRHFCFYVNRHQNISRKILTPPPQQRMRTLLLFY